MLVDNEFSQDGLQQHAYSVVLLHVVGGYNQYVGLSARAREPEVQTPQLSSPEVCCNEHKFSSL